LPRSHALYVLLSFPTRRSSDLSLRSVRHSEPPRRAFVQRSFLSRSARLAYAASLLDSRTQTARAASRFPLARRVSPSASTDSGRSEEHTSELQSRENLVCRLLL